MTAGTLNADGTVVSATNFEDFHANNDVTNNTAYDITGTAEANWI